MCILCTSMSASVIEKAFSSLAEYDYFRARKLFYQRVGKTDAPYACYGLALIFSRSDNPFHNTDSAGKYATLSYNGFVCIRKPAQFGPFTVDSASILSLARQIASKKLSAISANPGVADLDRFLISFALADDSTRAEAIRVRDGMELDRVRQQNRSRTTAQFIVSHPQSVLLGEAIQLHDRQVYEEQTRDKKSASYIAFLNHNPRSPLVNTAYEQLFGIYRKNSDVRGLAEFVKNYPSAPQNLEAWKLLFSLTVRAYSYAELKKFLDEYPAFPLRNSILKELELNKLRLYPFEKDGYSGFVDPSGRVAIQPVYDEVTAFSEGLSVVHRGDSACFVNKENVNPFNRCFTEAYVFFNGIAPVQLSGKWHFINRLGQVVSREYEEIGEQSDGLYVVKQGGKYGAVDQFGQLVIEPRFAKLGDFMNGYAYYSEHGKYGYVSKSGSTGKAIYDWISAFSPERLAVARIDGKYGLIGSSGRTLLECEYELIDRAPGGVYIVVENGMYGFFSIAGCFITQLQYEYQKEKPAEYYTDGTWFRITKKSQPGFVDANGSSVLPPGQYDEIGLPHAGLIAVRKKKKWGYIDRNLAVRIPLKYASASDFTDSVAVVSDGSKNILLDLRGTELFSTTSSIDRINPRLYFLPEERRIVNDSGTTVYNDVNAIQKPDASTVIVVLANGEMRVISE